MFWIRGNTAASIEYKHPLDKNIYHRPQLRDDQIEWPKIDFLKGLFLFFIFFYNSRNKNKVFVFVRFDVLYLIQRIIEKNCNHITYSAKLKN